MENPEEILHSLEEFSKSKPNDIPRELEEYLCFVAKTGDPVYQWSTIKSLLREKMIRVITEFYEACPSVEIPPCPNVDLFNYDVMKNFILEKLDTFAAAPFTVQRICELLTSPRKEYNRIDKYMRALEKNILVVSTTEPGGRRNTENGEGIVNGLESEHLPETSNSSNDINVEEMDDLPAWPRVLQNDNNQQPQFNNNNANSSQQAQGQQQETEQQDTSTNSSINNQLLQETVVTETPDTPCTSSTVVTEAPCSSSTQDSVITCRNNDDTFVSIEPVPQNSCDTQQEGTEADAEDDSNVSVTITAIPAGVQKRRNSVEPVVSSDNCSEQQVTVSSSPDSPDAKLSKDGEELLKDEELESSSSEQLKDADSSGLQDEQHKEEKSEISEAVAVSIAEDDNSSIEDDTIQQTIENENKEIEESTTTTTCSAVVATTTTTVLETKQEPCESSEIKSSDSPAVCDNELTATTTIKENSSESQSGDNIICNIESQAATEIDSVVTESITVSSAATTSSNTDIVINSDDTEEKIDDVQNDEVESVSVTQSQLVTDSVTEKMDVDEINNKIDDDDDDDDEIGKAETTSTSDSIL